MNRFYHKEDTLFDNELEAKEFAKKFIDKTIDAIDTNNDFKTFVDRYELSRELGNDIIISLGYAGCTDTDEDYLTQHWLFNGGNDE